jgi:copper transport protein
MEEALGAFAGVDCQIRPCGVADEERVAGQHETLVHDERAVLRPVSRRVQHPDRDGACLQHLTIREGLEVELGVGERMDGDGDAVLQRQTSMTRDVVGVGMGLEHERDGHAGVLRGLEIRLDRVCGVDQEGLPLTGIADQVGGAAEIVVDELAEQHPEKLTVRAASFLEALPFRAVFPLVLVCALALPAGAAAHARLLRSVPADGAVVRSAPRVVRIVFDDAVRVSSGIRAIRNDGGSVAAGKARVTGAKTLVIPLRSDLRNGDYTVLWRVLSDDGHTLSGVIAFGVGVGRAPPQAALSADNGPGVQSVVSRFLLFAGLLTAAGAAFFRFAVGRVTPRLLLGAFLLAFVGISGVAHDVSVSTRFGSVMAAAAVIAGVGALLAALAPLYSLLEVPAFVAALVLLPAPTLAGHALDRGRPFYEPLVDFLHLTAASVWLGGLVALGLALAQGGAERDVLVRRFSKVALASVMLLSMTGVIRALAELRTVGQVWSTGYGRVLIVKTVLLGALVVVGWFNRYRLIPRLSFDALRRNIAVELMLFATLVAAVALLTDLRPGRDVVARAAVSESRGPPPLPAAGMVVQAGESGDYGVALAVHGAGAEVTVLGQDGGGVTGLAVRIAGAVAHSCGQGCYGASSTYAGKRVRVVVAGRALVFQVPARALPASALVARATSAFRRLRSVDYTERLASSPRDKIVSNFTLERPDRLMYRIRGGADGIIIGTRRWDRTNGGQWLPSPQDETPEPEPIWAGHVTNAFLLKVTPKTYVVAFLKPIGPAWFTVELDRRTLRPRSLRMTAAAHFMTHRYTSFNAPRRIKPPVP